MHMSLWKFWAFALFTGIWLVITWDYFAELPDGKSLDVAVTEAQVQAMLGAMVEQGDYALAYHARGTRTLDMVLPALLGAFLLTGLSRYVTQAFLFGFGGLVLLYVGVDYWENMLHLRLLAGEPVFGANAWVSLLKFGLLGVPLVIVLAGLVRESYKGSLVRIGRLRQR